MPMKWVILMRAHPENIRRDIVAAVDIFPNQSAGKPFVVVVPRKRLDWFLDDI